jgi:putative ABC transport system permease protein
VNLAISQLRRAPVRTTLLVLVVSALLFGVEYLAAVSSSLQALNTGALAHLRADVIIYSASAEDSLDGSRLAARVVTQAAHVAGVAGAQALGVADFTVTGPDGGRYELVLLGLSASRAGWPDLVAGRVPGAGEALADTTEVPAGLGLGRRVVLEPGGVSLRVTGAAVGVRDDGLVTAWTTFGSWSRAVRAANPGGAVMPNAVAVQASRGVAPDGLARRLAVALPGDTVLTRAAAVADVPGASVLAATFDLLIAVTFIAAVLVIGSVFLLITVQRGRVWVLLRGLGASAGRLGLAVMAQAVLVVTAGAAVASAALAVVAAASGPAFPVHASPGLVITTAAATLTGALLSCLLPVRRIGRLDPAAALVRA